VTNPERCKRSGFFGFESCQARLSHDSKPKNTFRTQVRKDLLLTLGIQRIAAGNLPFRSSKFPKEISSCQARLSHDSKPKNTFRTQVRKDLLLTLGIQRIAAGNPLATSEEKSSSLRGVFFSA